MRILAGLMLAAALLISAVPVASAQTRTLKLYFTHTGERAEIAYKRNGRYIKSGLDQINQILRDWRRNEPTEMDPQLLDLLWEVYRATGARDYIHVVSAYRSPQTNAMLRSRSSGVAKKSQHMLGKAIDFFIPGVKLSTLRAVALKMEVGGVGYYPRSGSPFVHLDVGGVRHWPRMSRKELASLFPDGKTIHVPSDGKPLPGYQQALAAYEARQRNGGSIQVADANEGRRGRGILAALFGGGADEEEDNANAQVAAAPQPPRPVQQRQPAQVQQRQATPEAQPEAPQTILAALPSRAVPVPREAPRPDVGVGIALPVEAQGSEGESPAAAEDATPTSDELLMAANVPLPTSRPDFTPPAQAAQEGQASDEDQDLPVATAFVTPTSRPQRASTSDAIAELLAEQKDVPPQQVAVQGAPVPTARETGRRDFAVASLSPIMTGSPQESRSAKAVPEPSRSAEERSSDTSQRVALLKDNGARAAAFLSDGVKTAPKQPKPGPQDARRELEPLVLPVGEMMAANVLSRESLVASPRQAKIPRFSPEIAEAPKSVYTAGFQQEAVEIAAARRFTGKAVNFLSVAKFGGE